ncbi:sensor histidine kinase [Cohnella pontilimi]|nr:sensor histidine kinase [Cohnella pontilimi]
MIWGDSRWQMFVIALVTAAAGELKVTPFHEESFRIALGSITFLFLLLFSRSLSHVRIGLLTGIVVLLFRMLQDLLFGTGIALDVSLLNHLPASFFYILYGAGMSLIRRRLDDFNPLRVGALVAAIDFVSNSTELLIRKLPAYPIAFWTSEWLYLLVIAVVRSYFVIGLYSTLSLRQLQLVHAEQNKRMEQMLSIGAGLYGEVFYLKKSIEATEGIMAKSYKLYQQLKGSDLKEQSNQALRIAQEIHEVKKDSQRILAGLIKLFDKEIAVDLRLSELMDHAVRANEKYSEMLGKEVVFRRDSDVDFPVMHEIPLLTMLNNLLANAVEAIDGNGVVMIRVYQTSGDDTVFQITDSGHGIPEEERPLIFKPGFTTKFDKLGSASTGIGLSHVRDIVDYFGGIIHVDTGLGGKGSAFEIRLPTRSIRLEE